MRKWIAIIEEGSETPNEQPRIVAQVHVQQGVAIIHDFFIPKELRGTGIGRKTYEEWEAALPPSIKLVRLFSADYEGTGNADEFWDAMGFSYAYEGDNLDYESQHAMWKGVNGHPTPPTITVDDDEMLNEAIYYQGEITPQYRKPFDILVLKNPTSSEIKRLFRQATPVPYSYKELRAILTDDDLLMWDSSIASHDDITKVFGVEQGMSLYFYEEFFKMDDSHLRDPDSKMMAIEFVTNHPKIKRLYPNGLKWGQEGVHGFCFEAA